MNKKQLPLNQLVRELRNELYGLYSKEEADKLITILLEDLFGITQMQIIAHNITELEGCGATKLIDAVAMLKKHKPVQYITGKAAFYDLELLVDESVLIPRPETEEMIGLLLRMNKPFTRILDIGTGSGAIAISLKKQFPDARVCAVEKENDALKTAKLNAQRYNCPIDFFQFDFLAPSNWRNLGEPFNLVVSNPPYIRESEKALMKKNVLDYEPHTALFVTDTDPLVFYRKIKEFCLEYLSAEGCVMAEINENLGKETAALFSTGFSNVEVLKDLNSKDRFVIAFR